ncbi:PAS domain S-box-containing protein [Hoeflea marina]|uniref:histidine kinase n=1 Tax=Hoeflea marina TaxID=274592 RepID=A0A317PM73_9HYPH|nr:PAS domain S-box protein [Hoeflea marina]PWW01371.1 PAS domain S-box-containing protein [Hoeflea marina]
MQQARYPFIDLAVHAAIRDRFAAGEAVAVLTADLGDVLWANGAAARLFGYSSIYELLEGGINGQPALARQVESAVGGLARQPATNFMMRVASGFRRIALPARVEFLDLGGDETLILLSGGQADAAQDDAARARSIISGFNDTDTHVAVLDAEGTVLAASPSFTAVGLSTEETRRMVADVAADRDRMVKRMIGSARGPLPAAIGRLTDAPALHLLFVVEPAASEEAGAGEAATEGAAASPPLADAVTSAPAPATPETAPTEGGLDVDRLRSELEAGAPRAPEEAAIPFEFAQARDLVAGAPDTTLDPDGPAPVEAAGSVPPLDATGLASQVWTDADPDRVAQTDTEQDHDDALPGAQKDAEPTGTEVAALLSDTQDALLSETEAEVEAGDSTEPYRDTPLSADEPDSATDRLVGAGELEAPDESRADTSAAAVPEGPEFRFDPGGRPVRFVWKIDRHGAFSEVSPDFAAAVGPNAADIIGRKFPDIARVFNIDRDHVITDLLSRRDTWSGKTVHWPIQGTDLAAPVDLAALPTYTRDRQFDGFRGFGIVRPSEARLDPEALGLALVPGARIEPAADEAIEIDELSADAPDAYARLAARIEDVTTRAAAPEDNPAAAGEPEVTYEPVSVFDANMTAEEVMTDAVDDEDLTGGEDDDTTAEPEPEPEPEMMETPVQPADQFRGEVPALHMGSNLGRRESDKIIDLGERRARARDALSPQEQAAFQEIGVRLTDVARADAARADAARAAEAEAAGQDSTTAVEDDHPIDSIDTGAASGTEQNGLAVLPDADFAAADVGATAPEAEDLPRDAAEAETEARSDGDSAEEDSGADDRPDEAIDAAAESGTEQDGIAATADAGEVSPAAAEVEIESHPDRDTVAADSAPTDPSAADAGERDLFSVQDAAEQDESEHEEPSAEVSGEEVAEPWPAMDPGALPPGIAASGETRDQAEPEAARPVIHDADTPATDAMAASADAEPGEPSAQATAADPVRTEDHHAANDDHAPATAGAADEVVSGQLPPADGDDAAETPIEAAALPLAASASPTPSAFALPPRQQMPAGLTEQLVDAIPAALLFYAGEGLLHANPEFLALTGYRSTEDLSAHGGLDRLLDQPEADDRIKDGIMLMLRADGEQVPVSARLRSVNWHDTQALMLALSPASVLPDAATGDPSAFAGSEAEDPAGPMTDPVADSEDDARVGMLEIEASELRSILETATDGVIILRADGSIRSMNRSACALFNYDEQETRGKPFAMLFAHESQRAVMDYVSGLANHGVSSVLNDGREVIGREAAGGFLPLFMTMGHLTGSKGYCAVLRDITQWKRSEEELRNAKRAAETANSHKSDFLARVSHEIRTPLNAIIGFSEMMAEERFGPIGSPRYLEYAHDIGNSGKHVLDIVNDLLDISKIEAGQVELEFTAVALNDHLAECVSMLQPMANSQRVIIRTSLSATVPEVVADQRSIKQIALNLVSNAIRYTPSGGQIVVSTGYEQSGSVVLRIRDTGIGMGRKELEQAMKPFGQVGPGPRQRGDGTGLGLPLTKAMVESNRAQFDIVSAPGEGTLVTITFPPQRVLAD